MSNLSKRFKKELALILAVTMVFGSMQLPGMMSKVEATDVVTPVEFGTPVLKMGVLSDVHLAYGYDNSTSIQNKVKQYVRAVATLNKMAGDGLDVVMLAGDYTGYGDESQAKTFATASAAVMKHINSINGNNTQFFMTYGNHDTEWAGQMDYAGWESVLRGETKKVSDNMTVNLADEGSTYAEGIINVSVEGSAFSSGTFGNLGLEGSNNCKYEAVVNMTQDTTDGNYGSIRLVLGRGTYNETEGVLELAIRPNLSQVVLFHRGTAEAAPHVVSKTISLGEDIACSIQYKNGTLSFTMDNEPIISELNLAEIGITDIKLEPGFSAQGSQGTISNIEIWEDAYDLLAGVTPATDASGNALVNSGSYKYTKEVNGKTYTFLSVETESYYVGQQSNVFRNDVLEWLERELAATSKDSYVYVVSHAPIKESGVYGSDMEYDKNANWGTAKDGALTDYTITRNFGSDNASYSTSSSINSVLAKYPQVVYFSGHTHYTNRLESSIMADNYTAINVASVQAEDYFNNVNKYLDSATWNSANKEYNYGAGLDLDDANKDGYALYIEVDENGNQKIQRVNITDSQIVTEVTLSGAASDNTIDNPCTNDQATYPKISAYYTDSVTVTYNDEATAVTYGDAWVMAAPQADKSHLTPFTAQARNSEIQFNAGEFTLNEFKNTNGYGATLNFTFPTAYTSGAAKIIRYELTLYDENDKEICTEWILGNWINNTNGCAEGVDHTTATSLTYSHIYTEEQLNGATSVHATLTAVSEFGAAKTLNSTGNVSVDWGIQQPVASKANRNMFDGFTGDRIVLAMNTGENRGKVTSITESSDAFNSLAFTYDTYNNTGQQNHDEIVFAVDKNKYEANKGSFAGWALLTNNAKNMTDIDVEDTFVYETDFKIVSGKSRVYFTFRAPDMVTGSYIGDYSGLLINEHGVELWLNNEKLGWSGEFKLTDDKMHHLQVVSEPTCVTVWIDNTLVYYRALYSFDAVGTVANGTFVKNDDGTYTHTNPGNVVTKLRTKDMIPAIAMYASEACNFTVSNQALYRYDVATQGVGDCAGDEYNYYDGSRVTDNNSAISHYDANVDGSYNPIYGKNNIDCYARFNSSDIYANENIFANLDQTKFEATDTVTTEFTLTPSNLSIGSDHANASSVLHDVQIYFRAGNNKTMSLLLRSAGTYIFFGSAAEHQSGVWLKDNTSVKIRIESTNKEAKIYMNGNLTYNITYTANSTITADDTAVMMPYLQFFVRNGKYLIEDISVKIKGDTIPGVTALAQSDNLLVANGSITTDIITEHNFVVNGKTNFYTDMTATEGAEHIYLFGKNNVNSPLRSYDSFAISSLVKTTGGTVRTDVAKYGEKLVSYEIADTTLTVCENGTAVANGAINLASELGYITGDDIRFTTVVSSKGFDIYADGIKIYTYTATGKADYSVLKYSVSGAKVRFLDMAVWYSGDVGDYKAMLVDAIRTYEATLKGYYSDKKAEYDTKVAEIKANYESSTKSEECRKYLITIEKYIDDILTNGKAVNSQVKQSMPTKFTETSVDIVDDSTNQEEKRVSLLDNALSLNDGSAWVIEMDVFCVKNTTSAHVPRIGLGISETTGPNIMIQQTNVYIGPSWQHCANTTQSWTQNANWHVKWIVNPGVGLTTVITTVDGTSILNHEISWDNLQGVAGLTTLSPYLFFANVDCKVSNVYVNTLENTELMTASVKTNEIVNATSAGWDSKYLPLFNVGECDFTINDTWVVEADIAASNFTHVDETNGSNMRIGFKLARAYDASVMVQHNSKSGGTCYSLPAWTPCTNEWAGQSAATTNLRHGGEWHFKYIVRPDSQNPDHVVIRTEITTLSGEKIQAYEVSTATMGITVKDRDFYPELYVVSGYYEITNLYVGYDLTSDIETLKNANTAADSKKAETGVTNVSIQNIEETQQKVAPVIATTAAYTKAEINAATKTLNDVINSAITGSAVTISAENTGTATLYAADNEPVYIGYIDATYEQADKEKGLDGQLYIAGWTNSNGEAVTTWTEGENLTPKVIDTKMLTVKYQGEYAKGSTNKYRVRFLSSVNNALGDYTRAGLVFSLTDEVKNPDISTGIVRDTTTVYRNVNADGQSMNAETIYGEYSEFMYGRIINKIPEGQTFYVRAFVELLDGTIVYGVTREITVNASNLNIANQ